jgi:DNA-binding NarL/FixJ family response regulator
MGLIKNKDDVLHPAEVRTIRVVVIEDQTILRDLLCRLLEKIPGVEVIAQTGDGAEGYRLCMDLEVDLIITDLFLPHLSGIEILKQLGNKIKILVFSAATSPPVIQSAIQLGAYSFIHKNSPLSELESAITRLSAGYSYYCPVAVDIIRGSLSNEIESNEIDLLTKREREVIQLTAEGYPQKDIATKLRMSRRTVDSHRFNIMKKLDLHGVAAITRWAVSNGIVEAHR